MKKDSWDVNIDMNNLEKVLLRQLDNGFIISEDEKRIIKSIIFAVEEKTKRNLIAFKNKYFSGTIDPYNSVMYCIFLYELSRSIFATYGVCELADKVYYLNKSLNSVDLYYQIDLPNIWSCEHPLGSVLGRAKYSDGLMFYQGCTIGGNGKVGEELYPVIGHNLTMFSNSKIIGKAHIGDNVIMAANSYVIDTDIPSDSIVFGQGKNISIKKR